MGVLFLFFGTTIVLVHHYSVIYNLYNKLSLYIAMIFKSSITWQGSYMHDVSL